MDYDTKEHYIRVKGSQLYEVSNLGNIRNKVTGRVLSPQLNRTHDGYLRVTLDIGRRYVHRVVAESFFDCDIENCDINHVDGNKLNNVLWNLEVCTRKENIQHAILNGLRDGSVLKVVKCRKCRHRYEYDICDDKEDEFYCAYGEH